MPRISILSAAEQEQFEEPQIFDNYQRKKFFDFPKFLLEMAQGFCKPGLQIAFLLTCGYSTLLLAGSREINFKLDQNRNSDKKCF